MIKCPSCGEDNPSMIETTAHRREQVNCFCNSCSHSWVEIFKNIPKEDVLPKEIKK